MQVLKNKHSLPTQPLYDEPLAGACYVRVGGGLLVIYFFMVVYPLIRLLLIKVSNCSVHLLFLKYKSPIISIILYGTIAMLLLFKLPRARIRLNIDAILILITTVLTIYITPIKMNCSELYNPPRSLYSARLILTCIFNICNEQILLLHKHISTVLFY